MSKQQDQFLKVPYKILRATGYISKSGENVKMNLSDKLIYCHIKNRFEFFTKLGKEYFDTQQAIADAVHMDLKATGNILRKFIENDLTTIYKKPYNNYLKNVYLSVDNLTLYTKNKKGVILVQETNLDDFDYGDIPENMLEQAPDYTYESIYVDLDDNGKQWNYDI